MPKVRKKTKQEALQEAVAAAVGAGRELYLESVDFADPNRPKTCLEVDFPILPINHVSTIEGNAGKPIYQMSKWWARRRSSVFRAMLIAAATKAPDDPAEAAKMVWTAYYGNHQKNPQFQQLKVADIFMGGGTTVVEGARLGMQMYGNDLNPVAWFVVKNELAQVDPQEVQKLLDAIEAEVKPQIMPFYACDCPRGHKGQWKKRSTGEIMDASFDALCLTPDERPEYEYAGPEVIYTFWAKHGPCQATECHHRTPIMTTPVVAIKTLTVKAWADHRCSQCGQTFDIEQQEARMAPAAMLVVAPDEIPFAIMDDQGRYACPHCQHPFQDQKAAVDGQSSVLGKSKNKKIALTLLVHPAWLRGSPGKDADGNWFGGSVTDSAEATAAWNKERAKTLRLVEVRGKLPEQVICPDTGEVLYTDSRGGTMPRKAAFTCQENTCGLDQDVYESLGAHGKTGPVAMYAIQGYCPTCDEMRLPYSGRFFDIAGRFYAYNVANREWQDRKSKDLAGYWPTSEVPFGITTHIDRPLPQHGFTHWWTFFNSRQLLVHSLLLKTIVNNDIYSSQAKEVVLGVFQQYLRNQNMFCIWDREYDKLVPMLSNNNFAPKITVVENSVFARLGRGNWESCATGTLEALAWCQEPWELVSAGDLANISNDVAQEIKSKSAKTYPGDPVSDNHTLDCQSASDLRSRPNSSFDLVITDPPFGGLLHYSELSDFFYVWLRLALKKQHPKLFSSEYTPKALEAVANKARHGAEGNVFYQRILTECWREAKRILKPSGMLAFTFHHSEDEPWVAAIPATCSKIVYDPISRSCSQPVTHR